MSNLTEEQQAVADFIIALGMHQKLGVATDDGRAVDVNSPNFRNIDDFAFKAIAKLKQINEDPDFDVRNAAVGFDKSEFVDVVKEKLLELRDNPYAPIDFGEVVDAIDADNQVYKAEVYAQQTAVVDALTSRVDQIGSFSAGLSRDLASLGEGSSLEDVNNVTNFNATKLDASNAKLLREFESFNPVLALEAGIDEQVVSRLQQAYERAEKFVENGGSEARLQQFKEANLVAVSAASLQLNEAPDANPLVVDDDGYVPTQEELVAGYEETAASMQSLLGVNVEFQASDSPATDGYYVIKSSELEDPSAYQQAAVALRNSLGHSAETLPLQAGGTESYGTVVGQKGDVGISVEKIVPMHVQPDVLIEALSDPEVAKPLIDMAPPVQQQPDNSNILEDLQDLDDARIEAKDALRIAERSGNEGRIAFRRQALENASKAFVNAYDSNVENLQAAGVDVSDFEQSRNFAANDVKNEGDVIAHVEADVSAEAVPAEYLNTKWEIHPEIPVAKPVAGEYGPNSSNLCGGFNACVAALGAVKMDGMSPTLADVAALDQNSNDIKMAMDTTSKFGMTNGFA